MAFSFNPALATPLDRIRQTIGDTQALTSDVPDETIGYYVGTGLSEGAVSLQLCRDMMALYAKTVDVTVDHQTTKAGQAYQNYKTLAAQLQARIGLNTVPAGGFGGVFVGGLGDGTGPWDVETVPDLVDYPNFVPDYPTY